MMSANRSTCSAWNPRCVIHGVPRRMPLGVRALLSPGMVLRLQTMPARSRMRAATSPISGVPFLRSGLTPDAARTLLQSTQQQVRVGAAIGDVHPTLLELGRQQRAFSTTCR